MYVYLINPGISSTEMAKVYPYGMKRIQHILKIHIFNCCATKAKTTKDHNIKWYQWLCVY